MIRRISVVIIAAATIASVAAVIGRVRIITTNSAAPAGIYRTVAATLTRGDLVLACLPRETTQLALERGYLGAGDCLAGAEPIAKVIGALPGDTVELEQGFVAVNGIRIPDSPTLPRDSAGRPLAHVAWGTRRVPEGEVWLFGFNNPRSWDGRYLGSVPTDNVLGVLEPLITW